QPKALWSGNFRDLSSSVSRMATLANGGRVTCEDVNKEIQRLEKLWSNQQQEAFSLCKQFLPNTWQQIDDFDLFQLEAVLAVCQQANSLSEAGRQLFAQSRQQKASSNDADRLKKYLAKFELEWNTIKRD
ncbi:MAG TPA: sigma 54-dependent transcriptional regulator, partial [Agitococcus sp.]|nr:sigma 54-dependent transcriptional regulator [Agitococcus sp.]